MMYTVVYIMTQSACVHSWCHDVHHDADCVHHDATVYIDVTDVHSWCHDVHIMMYTVGIN